MKILLINSPTWLTVGHSISESPPLGLLYLAAVIEKNGYYVKVIDADALKLDLKTLAKKIREKNPDVIGLSGTSLGLPSLLKVADICREIQPKAKIISGGIGTTIEPKEVLNNNSNIDAAFIGEAEESIINYLSALENNLPLKSVKGIAFLDNNQFYQTEIQSPPDNLDAIPFPAYHLLEPEHNAYHGVTGEWEGVRRPSAAIMSSRGCPHRCTFCSNKTIKTRWRSPKNIADEIEFCRNQFGINSIQFFDNEFIGMTAGQNQWIKEVCQEIIDRKLDNISYLCQGRCNKFVDLETLKIMKRAGFCWIWWGVESGSDKVLKLIKKDITVQEVKRAFRLAKQAGIRSLMFIMVGFPGETKNDVMLTARLVKQAKPDRVSFHIVTPLPGSELRDQLVNQGMIDEFDYSKYDMKLNVVHHTDTMTRDEIKEMYEMLSFRFRRGYWYFLKIFFKSLLDKNEIKKTPMRFRKTFRYFINWLDAI